jgi:hypothetical protein
MPARKQMQLTHASTAEHPLEAAADTTDDMWKAAQPMQELRGHQPFCVQEAAGSRLRTYALRNPQQITCSQADVQWTSTVSGGLVPEPDTKARHSSCTPAVAVVSPEPT